MVWWGGKEKGVAGSGGEWWGEVAGRRDDAGERRVVRNKHGIVWGS
jgi:hypothetical protein